jgi:hypothetical protein
MELEQFLEASSEAAPVQKGNCRTVDMRRQNSWATSSCPFKLTFFFTICAVVRVLYDYDAQSDLELTIRENEVVVLTSTDCSEGWWEGTVSLMSALKNVSRSLSFY